MAALKIHIKDDIYTIVDCDIAKKIKSSIYLSCNGKYLQFNRHGKSIYLHRFVMDASNGQMVDHINRNTFDNRRCNLRFVTRSQNNINKKTKRIGMTGYKRVYKFKNANIFYVQCSFNLVKHYSGCYRSKTVAALFADNVIKNISTVTPKLNFPSRIKRCHLHSILKRTRGRIFGVIFVRRKDGHERHMLCRLNVNKNVKGAGLLFEPEKMNLLPVYDVTKKEHRFIPMENVLCLTFKKKKYRVTN